MPFLAPLIPAITGAIAGISAWAAASPILAGIVTSAFGIAAKYALSSIFKPEEKARASRLEVEYGSDLARSVGMGYYGTSGHWVYRNAYGKGNRNIQDVFVVSHFLITDIPRVRYQGEWVSLDGLVPYPPNPEFGVKLPVDGDVFIKIYYGTQTQVADPALITYSNPAGRWTATDIGKGIAYVIVTQTLNRNKQTSPQQLFFEVKGAPLYDWRLDTTVGGSGPQRWNDQSTWVFSENPTLMEYGLERGFFNGTQKMVGKGVPAARLPLAKWTLAANICDELVTPVGGGPQVKKYRAALIATSGANSTHDANMQPLLESMAGAWVETVDGEYPIAGAEQLVSFTITDDDIMPTEPYRFSAKTPRAELINTVSSTYPSPEKFYAMVPASTRIDAAALADDDGETLASAIPYEAVIYSEQVDRLADIAIRAARYQGNAEIVIRPAFLELAVPGRWIQWNSARVGNMTWQIVSVTKGALNQSTGARNIYLSLREISDGVFDPTAYVTDPPGVDPVGNPDYLAEVQGFSAIPNLVTGSTGEKIPGVKLTWNTIDDITVTGVYIEYWPTTDPTQIFKLTIDDDTTTVQIVEGLTSNTDWFTRTKLLVDPKRPVAFSGTTAFHTLVAVHDFLPIDVDDLNQDLIDYSNAVAEGEREVKRQLLEIGSRVANQFVDGFNDRLSIRREIALSKDYLLGRFQEDINIYLGPNGVIVDKINRLNVNLGSANDKSVAMSSIIDALSVSVSINTDQIATQAISITGLESQVNDPSTGLIANSTAITSVSTVANTANTLAGTKNRVFRQTTVPSALAIGDIWLDSDDSNKMYRATATGTGSWVLTDDTRIGTSATAITTLQSTLDDVTATSTFRMFTRAAPSGWTASIAMQTRVNSGSTFRTAGLYLDSTATLARVSIVADQFILTDNTNNVPAFSMIGGALYLTGSVNIENANIGTLTVGTSNIVAGAVTVHDSATLASGSWSGSNRDVAVTINHGTGSPKVTIWGTGGFRASASPSGSPVALIFRILAAGSTINTITACSVAASASGGGTICATHIPASGTASTTYTFRMGTADAQTAELMTIAVLVVKR